ELNLLSIESALAVDLRAMYIFLTHLTNIDLLPIIAKTNHKQIRQVLIRRLKFTYHFEPNKLYYVLRNDKTLFEIATLQKWLQSDYTYVVQYIINYCNRKDKTASLYGFKSKKDFVEYMTCIV